MSVFCRNLYDTDETNSILEIKLALYSSIFEETKSSFSTIADFLCLLVVTHLILLYVSFCTFCSADTITEILGCAL
jgi:hypothetical protein